MRFIGPVLMLILNFSLVLADAPKKNILHEARDKMKSLNQMRESLAGTLDDKSIITEETFNNVCRPVGKELMRWAQEKGYKAKQIALKNRNPQNHLVGKDIEVFREFEKQPELSEKTIDATVEGQSGALYYHRITVQSSCLHCHGSMSSRPDFIKAKYPQDKAYGFQAGDLRGLYRIFIPVESNY